MLEEFKKYYETKFSFLEKKKLLLAVSGGLDSMVMVHLFRELNANITLAHCNFQLRGAESDEDQFFITEYASINQIPLLIAQFDTQNFAEDQQLSIQMAARELRYSWFHELLEKNHLDYLITAHHADDNLETFFINLSRGTGLEGLTGIPIQNGKIIRPLLTFSRNEIENYALENRIKWREDSSNASVKYVRNKIRHDLIPVLKSIQPNFLKTFEKTQLYLQQTQAMADDASKIIYEQVTKKVENDIYFDLKKVKKWPHYKAYLYQWFVEYGFSDWESIADLMESQSGKQIFSEAYTILKNRDFLILSSTKKEPDNEPYFVKKNQKEVKVPLKMNFSKVADILDLDNKTIFVDEDKLQFPLLIRKWREGDTFQPFGMEGKSKKVSKFFKDEKLSLFEKNKTWLLCSENQIVWIIGMRFDHRFRVEPNSKKIVQIKLKE